MWRILSLKSLVALVIVLGLTLLIMSRISKEKTDYGGFKPLGVMDPKEDADIHYYSNNRYNNHKQKGRIKNGEPGKDQEVVDYPFDDDEKENDFDPLSAPGEEEAKKVTVPKPLRKPGKSKGSSGSSSTLDGIQCDVNSGKYLIDCKQSADEVYIPFSFLRKYYEIYGKMSDTKAGTFLWSHSPPIKIYRPRKRYDPKGVFAFFDNYNVEVRDRVKCVSGSTGVPVSTQWDVNGYFYPIQIAQFGLSHYSKSVTEKPPTRVILENSQDVRGNWILEYSPQPRPVPDPENPTNQVLAIKATKGVSGINNDSPGSVKISLEVVQRHLLILSMDLRITNRMEAQPPAFPVNVTITVKARYETQIYFVHYVTADFHIKVQENHIFYGLGYKSQGDWQHIIRDIGVDIQKGVSGGGSKKKQQKLPRSKLILESLSISNVNSFDAPLLVDNVTLSSTEHMPQFFQAVDWFVDNQDSQGGWPIPVSRKFNQASNFYPTLRPGWYSAMGQGHGLSLLARAYALTKDSKYASACEKALRTIFDHPGTENLGVRAIFMDEYVWYEEYPTTPSSFVLNGFIYSLLGLYDVHTLRIPGATEKAKQLYNDGIRSLIKMLPLYDTGSGTFYDLRHFTVPGIAPNLARLDYHVTHINQLLILATIHDDPIFETTAARWIQYSEGERAPHN